MIGHINEIQRCANGCGAVDDKDISNINNKVYCPMRGIQNGVKWE